MYVPKAFAEHDAALLHEAIARYPLATLVTAYDGALVANHLPMLADPDRADTLLCHVARANALWTTVEDRAEVLAVFSGPEAYVSPSFYATKREHGRVVPTWNYVAVHVYGTLRVLDGPAALRRIVGLLTAAHEASHAQPWHVEDAPEAFIEQQLGAIVGLELRVARVIGKWKLSQNRSEADRAGVEAALRASPQANDRETADAMVERRSRDTNAAD